LSATGILTKPLLAECIAEAELPPLIRAERLTLKDFVQLSRGIARRTEK
jgi:hypothetical protein